VSNFFVLNQKINRIASNYLLRFGWFNGSPKDSEGPTPWFTYPAISFTKDIVSKAHRVLEYGCGYSTAFFNQHAGECHSVEHNPEWRSKLLGEKPEFSITLCTEGEPSDCNDEAHFNDFLASGFELPTSNNRRHNVEHGLLNAEFRRYAAQIFRWPKGHFDMIVIDGMARSLSGFYASRMIDESGIIILDNSDRWQYNSLQEHLVRSGFGRIDFWGLGPVNDFGWCTSFFSRRFAITNQRVKRPPKSGDLGW
jgi:hypothetical protein